MKKLITAHTMGWMCHGLTPVTRLKRLVRI